MNKFIILISIASICTITFSAMADNREMTSRANSDWKNSILVAEEDAKVAAEKKAETDCSTLGGTIKTGSLSYTRGHDTTLIMSDGSKMFKVEGIAQYFCKMVKAKK